MPGAVKEDIPSYTTSGSVSFLDDALMDNGISAKVSRNPSSISFLDDDLMDNGISAKVSRNTGSVSFLDDALMNHGI